MDFQTIVGGAGCLYRLQALETPDAVVHMDDEVAGGQASSFCDEVFGTARRAPGAHETVTENVLFADDSNIIGLKTEFDPKHCKGHGGFRQGQRLRPIGDRCQIVKFVIVKNVAHALARAFAPQRNHDPLAHRV